MRLPIDVFLYTTLLFVIVVLVVFYVRLQRKFVKEKEQRRLMAEQTSQEVLAAAQKEAARMLDGARIKAGEIINNAQFFNSQQTRVLADTIEKTRVEYQRQFSRELDLATRESIGAVQSISQSINSSLEAQQKAAQDELSRTIEEIKTTAKKEALALFDKELSEKVGTVAREILKREIDMNEHRELVINSLDQAKKDGLF